MTDKQFPRLTSDVSVGDYSLYVARVEGVAIFLSVTICLKRLRMLHLRKLMIYIVRYILYNMTNFAEELKIQTKQY